MKHTSLFDTLIFNSLLFSSKITGYRYPGIPRLKGNFLYGRLLSLFDDNQLASDIFRAGELAAKHESGLCYFWLATNMLLVVTQPAHLEQLAKNKDLFKLTEFDDFVDYLGGSFILADEKELWSPKREVYDRLILSQKALEKTSDSVTQELSNTLHHIQSNLGKPLDLHKLFSKFILANTLKRVLNIDPSNEQLEALLSYLHFLHDKIVKARTSLRNILPKFLANRLLIDPEKFSVEMKKIFQDNLFSKNNDSIYANEFINMIHKIRGKDSALETNMDVIGEINVVLIGGTSTVLSSLLALFKYIKAHPTVESKLIVEINAELPNQEFSFSDTKKLKYLDNIVNEVLRLVSPAPLSLKRVLKSFKLGNIRLAKGDTLITVPYITHRLPQIWDKPEEFIPERFDSIKNIHRYAYRPFGMDQHQCPGRHLGMQTLKFIIAVIYKHFDFKILNNDDMSLIYSAGALRPKVTPIACFDLKTG